MKANIKEEIPNLKDGNEVVLSLSVENKDEVDKCAEEVKKLGGAIYAEPEKSEKGYFFGFSDPEWP